MTRNLNLKATTITIMFITRGEYCPKIINSARNVANLTSRELKICKK